MVQLTQDHNCYNAKEVEAVHRRCPTDPCPVRSNRTDRCAKGSTRQGHGKDGVRRGRATGKGRATRSQAHNTAATSSATTGSGGGGGGIQRVAGSLAVTRAFGDAYLKDHRFSTDELKKHVPYITAEPELTARPLSERDLFVVLASDGVWEVGTNEQVAQWVQQYSQRPEHGRTVTLGQEVVVQVLSRVASSHSLKVAELHRLSTGAERRRLHDDITCTVVVFKAASHHTALATTCPSPYRGASCGQSAANSCRLGTPSPPARAVPSPART